MKNNNKIKRWTSAELKRLEELYKEHTIKECSEILGVEESKIRCATRNHKMKSGRSGYFEKGHTPFNKGVKGPTSEKCLLTAFQKGHSPHNEKPDGAISIRADKNGTKYKWIRVEKGQWKMLHVFNWEGINGPMPKGKILVFSDGDQMNCEPENLILIDRGEHMLRNQNPEKAAQSMRVIYQRERIRKKYDLRPLTGLGKRIVNY